MNEEKLKKGCRKYIGYVIKLGFKIDYKCGDLIWDEVKGIKEIKYCPICQARLEGFQKGKLEQKKEELKFLKERCIYCMIADERIKQLQKEIHSQQNPTQSNGSMNNGLGTSSADTKEIKEEKQDEN